MSVKKLAVCVRDLGPSQLTFRLIAAANELVGAGEGVDVLALFERPARPCLAMNFAATHLAEGYGYDGVVLATSLSTARAALGFPSASRRLFYLWDLEWLRGGKGTFRRLRAVYGDPRLTLLARSPDHAAAARAAWNREAVVVDDLDLARVLEVAGS